MGSMNTNSRDYGCMGMSLLRDGSSVTHYVDKGCGNAILNISNGRILEIRNLRIDCRRKPNFQDCFLTKTKALGKLASGKPVSLAEFEKAMEGLDKYIKTGGTNSQKKKKILNKLFDGKEDVAGGQKVDRATKRVTVRETEESKEKQIKSLKDIFQERSDKLFSKNIVRSYGEVMSSILDKALRDRNQFGSSLDNFKNFVENKCNNLANTTFDDKLSEEGREKAIKDVFFTCIQDFREELVRQLDNLSPGGGQQLFKKFYFEALDCNPNAWNKIKYDTTFIKSDGTPLAFHHELIPANEMECFSHLGTGERQCRGISSMNRNSDHIANMWFTTHAVKDSSGNEHKLFDGVRHGCITGNYPQINTDKEELKQLQSKLKKTISKKEVSEDEINQVKGSLENLKAKILKNESAAKEQKCKEILTACLVQKVGGVENLIKEEEIEGLAKGSEKDPYPIRLANIQLMTAGSDKTPGADKLTDGKLPENQMQVFNKMYEKSRHEPIKLIISDGKGGEKSIFVKMEPPLLFNFGCNLQQYNKVTHAAVVKDLDEENNKGFEVLIGDSSKIVENMKDFDARKFNWEDEQTVSEIISNLPESSIVETALNSGNCSEYNKKVIIQLSHQIAKIKEFGNYQTNDSEPFAIHVRTAMLAYLTGSSTSFNCKSGKDRTGIMDAELQHFANEIEMNDGIVPEAYHRLGDEEKRRLNETFNKSGATDITKDNTGIPGQKAPDKFGPLEFRGTADRLGDVAGASKLATE